MTDLEKEHYFDWAATSPCDEDIFTSSAQETFLAWGNPSSSHNVGKKAKVLFDEARAKAAKALNVKPETIYFTSGGTESDHIPLLAVMSKPVKGTVLISSIEHPALREQADSMKKCGWKVVSIPADKNGIIQPETVKNLLTPDTMIVCIMAVNNETGAIQPVKEIADVITEFGKGHRKPKFHVDCVQAAGKIPLNIGYSGIDSAAFSSHKICGPRGIGILYLKDAIDPFLKGGGQEKGIRSGTENTFGAIAFSKCLERYIIKDENPQAMENYKTQIETTNEFVLELSKIPSCTIVPEGRLENSSLYSPYVVQAAFKNIPGNVMLRALDAKGFYISTGSACSSKKASRPILEAMGIQKDIRETAVRFSFGPHTKKEAILELLNAVKEINKTFNN